MTPDFIYSISCTTRKPRQCEKNGEDYHFLSEKDFDQKVQAGEFLEHATVHLYRYGTLKAPILKAIEDGVDVLLDVDVQGAENVRNCGNQTIAENLADIFILPPSLKELDRRLHHRATETEQEMKVRLATAVREIEQWNRYKYVIVSGSPEDDLKQFRMIMRAEQALSKRLTLEK
jgi:guanylate kinase